MWPPVSDKLFHLPEQTPYAGPKADHQTTECCTIRHKLVSALPVAAVLCGPACLLGQLELKMLASSCSLHPGPLHKLWVLDHKGTPREEEASASLPRSLDITHEARKAQIFGLLDQDFCQRPSLSPSLTSLPSPPGFQQLKQNREVTKPPRALQLQ